MIVVEALAPVIDWHQRELVPNGKGLSEDARCRYYHADFFALARGAGFVPDDPGHAFDAILLDIDHTPDALLHNGHADFYSEKGMIRLKAFLRPGGVFGYGPMTHRTADSWPFCPVCSTRLTDIRSNLPIRFRTRQR
jgi:hypothetical protein